MAIMPSFQNRLEVDEKFFRYCIFSIKVKNADSCEGRHTCSKYTNLSLDLGEWGIGFQEGSVTLHQ